MCHIDNKLLERLMDEKGIEPKDLAAMAQIDTKTVYNLLNAKTRPCYDVLLRIIFALELTIMQIEELTIRPNQDLLEEIRENVNQYRS